MAIIDYTDALESGWRIFPLHEIINTNKGLRCGCGDADCPTVGKHPRAGNWQHTPDWDDVQLEYLEDEGGEFLGNQLLDGYGIVLKTSGLIIVDVDGRNGGFESAKKLDHIRSQCKYIVKSGSHNGEHWYFKATKNTEKSLATTLKDYPGIDFKSSGYVVGSYSLHASGERYEAMLGSPSEITEAPTELINLIERKLPDRMFEADGEHIEIEELCSIVEHIPNLGRDYDHWINVGMGIHDATSGDDSGYQLWVNWSSKCDAHDERLMSMKWHSFGKAAQPITAGYLVKQAKDNGYCAPVTFVDDTVWDDIPEPAASPIINDDSSDLSETEGLAGDVFRWIDSRCLFPRKILALAAALQVVGNAAGLRYRVDKKYRVTLNLMTFAIADSGSGKEAVYQAGSELISAAGMASAMHGGIKSEQELVRNAVRSQASLYMVDEFGAMLSKIGSAKKKGNASYLEAVPAEIMKIYTKANSNYLVTGDMREHIDEKADKVIAALQKRIDEGRGNEKTEDQLAQARFDKAQASGGIQKPFLSFFGISEPSSFDAAIRMDPDMLVNGFLGRALLFREHEALPLRRPEYNPTPMPAGLQARLHELYADGAAGDEFERVQLYGEERIINVEREAEKELDSIYMYWRSRGLELEHEGLGLHTITTRVWEMVIKVAGILAIPSGINSTPIIKHSHVLQAHAIVRKVTDFKISHCISVIGADSTDNEERVNGIIEGVMTVINSHPDGIGAGVIRNRNKKYGRENVNKCLEALITQKRIKELDYTDSRGRTQIKYACI